MTLPLRMGLFPYLNVQPLVHGIRGDATFELVIDLPSRIADRFRRGEIDVAMIPSFEAATMQASILDGVCIASDGAVETVVLHHRSALADVRTLALDEASRTSAALSKILITHETGHTLDCRDFDPRSEPPPETDAILVIGDPAFRFGRPGYRRLDLGEAWRAREALPFVFALMVAKPGVIDRAALTRKLREATRRGLDQASAIARSYNSGVDAARAEHYLREVIRYELGERERKGLARFYALCEANGLLPPP